MHRCAEREIDQIISLNRGRVRFRPPRKPQRMSIIPVVRGIFLTRRRSNYYAGRGSPSLSLSLSLSLSRPSIESYVSILQTFEGICGHTVSDDVANQLIIGPLEGSLLFTVQRLRRITPVEKFCRIWEVNRARQTFFSLRLSTHRLSRESFLEI